MAARRVGLPPLGGRPLSAPPLPLEDAIVGSTKMEAECRTKSVGRDNTHCATATFSSISSQSINTSNVLEVDLIDDYQDKLIYVAVYVQFSGLFLDMQICRGESKVNTSLWLSVS